MYKSAGFTIVEVIIVCVVVGILAGIGIVSWSGTLSGGRDRTRASEQQDWQQRFETYRQRYNLYPNASDTTASPAPLSGRYCLGTGFDSRRCGSDTMAPRPTEHDFLMAELSKVGTLPDYKHQPVGTFVGPWVDYTNSARIRIYQVYEGSCPANTTADTSASYNGATTCYVELLKN